MARRMDHEGAARRERLQRNGFEVIETEATRARRLKREAREAERAARGQEEWRKSDYAYCIQWLMKLHGEGYMKAQRRYDATPLDIRRVLLKKARHLRQAGLPPS